MTNLSGIARAIASAAALLIVLAGCAPAGDDSPTVLSPVPTADATPDDRDDASAAAAPLDAVQAADLAVQITGGGAVVDLESSTEAGRPVWDVDVLLPDGSGVELDLDVDTGEVVKEEPTDLDGDQRVAPAVTAQQAMGVALGAVPGSIIEADLEDDDSRLVWHIEVAADAGGRFEVEVDASTAAILDQEQDD